MIVKLELPEQTSVRVGSIAMVSSQDGSYRKGLVIDDKIMKAMVNALIQQPLGRGEVAFFHAQAKEGSVELLQLAPWQSW